MVPPCADAIPLLRDSALFGGLMDEDYDLLCQGSRTRRFEGGTQLFYEHDEGGSAFLILEGCVSIERTAEGPRGDAETVQIAVRGPGEFIGELSLFDDALRNADARATEPTTVLQLRGRYVLDCAQQSPELSLALMKGLARKLREATDRRTKARVQNVRTRLLDTLHEEARLHGVDEPAGVRIPLATPTRRLTQADLGQRAGCDRAVVNRTLAELADEGLLEKDKDSILVRRLTRRQAVAGTLVRAAREGGGAGIPERLLRGAPAALATSPEALHREIGRLVEEGTLARAEGRVEIRDEATLTRVAAGKA